MHDVAELLGLPSGAKFWRTDLHVHTPASGDMDPRWQQATPADVVQQALTHQLEIIAVTDHNSAAWCDAVREAARGSALHVFPGAEISTREGHILAIFDRDKPVGYSFVTPSGSSIAGPGAYCPRACPGDTMSR